MELNTILEKEFTKIIDSSLASLNRAQLESYHQSSESENRERFERLLRLLQQGVKEKCLQPIKEYSTGIAKERFAAGYDLQEVFTAYNVIEEEIWKRIIASVDPEQIGRSLGLMSTVLGAGKETLGVTYVSLATKTKTKTLNLTEIFDRL
jgi:hypothetical protein